LKSKKWVRSRRFGVVLAAGSAGSLLLLGLAGTAGASTQKIAIAQGLGAHELSTLPFPPPGPNGPGTPPATPETVSFVLQMRNEGSLEASVSAGMPRGYLSVAQFARTYGQSQGNISALEHYLAGYGITASSDADGLDVTANGTAGEFDSALSVQQHQYKLAAVKATGGRLGRKAMTVHGTTDTPLLPRSIGQYVLAVLGLDDYPTFGNDAVKALAPQKRTASDGSSSTVAPFLEPPSYFTSQYNLTPLLSKGATGAGQTIGIVTLAALNPADPEYFWNNVLGIATKPNRITLDNVDGGPTGGVSSAVGSDETTLDVEQSGAIAPDANIVVYQAPNTDYGFTGAFYTAASQNIAGSVSASWGESETIIQDAINTGFEDPDYVQTFDNAFLEMAAQGQSVFTSSDDEGAYGATEDQGSTNLAVDNPADSPWVTAAGGTTAAGTQDYGTFSITVPQTRAWGWDYLWPYWSDFGADNETDFVSSALVGGGGGFSVDERTPSYQQGINGTHHYSAVQYLNPTGYKEADGLYLPYSFTFNPDPSVSSGPGTGRALPDLSTNADPQTGYELYFAEFGAGNEIQDYGGTSFVAPQLNGSTAVINSYLGHRVGFWNPSIYQFATMHNSPFTPLNASGTSNDNLYYTGTPGTIYNEATGLGTPNLAKLASDFAHYGG
jgi:subtilase family serine protease